MASIQTNIMAFQAEKALKVTNRKMTTAMERLATGFKINRAGDDPAGLAISTRMTAQISGYEMAASHAADAISMLQTVEGALTEVANLMQRMRQLAVQATTTTFSTNDRAASDTEYQQLEAEVSRIIADTKWNTMGVLNGSGPESGKKGTFLIQVGADSGMTIGITLGSMSTKAGETLTALNALVITSQATAAYAVSKIDTAFDSLNTKRAQVGAFMNRMQGALDNALSMAQELTNTRSKILDTDYAETLAELARLQIIQQAGNAMLAQANAQPQNVLALLQ